jgi:murein L,D-transpeptidase YcbB/YkuD
MHDTPAKNLFQRDNRAYSHGCVRLEDPRAMAAAVLGKSREYVASQLGGGEKGEKVSEKIPVFISYFTAWPNDAGQVEYHPDMYKRDMYLGRALEAVAKARAASS